VQLEARVLYDIELSADDEKDAYQQAVFEIEGDHIYPTATVQMKLRDVQEVQDAKNNIR
jgi:hypothetical protein